MYEILLDKFTRNQDIKEKLLATGEKYLEERLIWHDNVWGNCVCEKCGNKGANNLGLILMKIRNEIQNEPSK